MIIKLIFISFLIMNLLLACEKQDNKEVTSENNTGVSTDNSSDNISTCPKYDRSNTNLLMRMKIVRMQG